MLAKTISIHSYIPWHIQYGPVSAIIQISHWRPYKVNLITSKFLQYNIVLPNLVNANAYMNYLTIFFCESLK